MGADFFDGLGETITRTAKEIGERAEQVYEAQKIRNKISAEERAVSGVMEEIGKIIYKRHCAGEALDGELSGFCEIIDSHILKIKEFKASAADKKGRKICPACEKAVDKSVSFCPYCGTPCPDSKPQEERQEEECCCGSDGAEGEGCADEQPKTETEPNLEEVIIEQEEAAKQPESEDEQPEAEQTVE